MSPDMQDALGIGSIVGGRTAENRIWDTEITLLSQEVTSTSASAQSNLTLNVIFHVPGHLLQPDFEGIRTGSFIKAKRILIVQVALPTRAPDDVRTYLVDCLRDSVDVAIAWAARRKVVADFSVQSMFVASLAAAS